MGWEDDVFRKPSFLGVVVLGVLTSLVLLLLAGCTDTSEPSGSTPASGVVASTTTSVRASTSTEPDGDGTTDAPRTTTTKPPSKPKPGQKVAYLTFDDGPSARTPELLAVLKDNQVKATFFVIGTVAKAHPGMLKRIADDGHVIGVHSWTHDYAYVYKSTDNFLTDFKKLRDYIKKETGVAPNVCRFPGGTNNTVCFKYSSGHIMKKIVPLVKSLGFTYYDWNVSSAEASSPPPDKARIIGNVISGCKKKDVAVILFHDADIQDYVDAVPEIITKLRSMGFTFETLSPDSPPKAKQGLAQFKPS
jgi:peptidoglycan/xylan/chitin deacetylase (PgdA/CDA1 family)